MARSSALKVCALLLIGLASGSGEARAQSAAAPGSAPSEAAPAPPNPAAFTEKINAYVACLNRLSQRSYESRQRYFSWASPKGPTGKERIIYGTYTIYDTADCRNGVTKVAALEPRLPELEAAAAAFAEAVGALEPLLKEADTYYRQEDYKDDRMAKGRQLHPRLVAAWDAFAAADQQLRAGLREIEDKRTVERIAEIERIEGRKGRYHIEVLMLDARGLHRTLVADKPDVAKAVAAIAAYEKLLAAADALVEAKEPLINSRYVDAARGFLTSAKQLMRRLRDKVPYSQGERMMINAGSSWMVEGSPGQLTRVLNQLVSIYNDRSRF